MHIITTFVLTIYLFVAGVVSAQAPREPTIRSPQQVWVGPNPFNQFKTPGVSRPRNDVRTLRQDWIPILTDASAWKFVLEHTSVLKTYIMILGNNPSPQKAITGLTDTQLKALVQFTRDHALKMAFEVGGLRTSALICGNQAGEMSARRDLALLDRWLTAGGQIDFITTDHALVKNMRGGGFAGPGLNPQRECNMTLIELTIELADYFQAIHKHIPRAKLGAIESLGYFHVKGDGETHYSHTDAKLPDWLFTAYFDGLVRAMKDRAIELDHFHIDFGYRGVKYDGRASGTLDFGRVLAVEKYVQSKGVKSGLIVNATLDRDSMNVPRDAANREVHLRALRFYNAYSAAGGHPDHLLFQWWHAYPDATGPEDKPFSALNVTRDILRSAQHARIRPSPTTDLH